MIVTGSWGNVPEWIGGVGTAAAFIFAALVFWYELHARRRDEHRTQARLVDAWVVDARVGRLDVDDPTPAIYATYAVVNGSAQAVRHVEVISWIREDIAAGQHCSVVPPTGNEPMLIETKEPIWGLTDALVSLFKDETGKRIAGILTDHLSLTFTDAGGRKWRRDDRGNLKLEFSLSWLPKRWKPGSSDDKRRTRVRYALGAWVTTWPA